MESMHEEDKWKAENDARTLKEAEMIRGDKKRNMAAMKVMEKEMEAMMQAHKGSMASEYGYMPKGE